MQSTYTGVTVGNAARTDALRWTLALSGQSVPARTSEQGDLLCVRSARGLETSLLVRLDGYLAAHGVPDDPSAVLDHLAAYLPL